MIKNLILVFFSLFLFTNNAYSVSDVDKCLLKFFMNHYFQKQTEVIRKTTRKSTKNSIDEILKDTSIDQNFANQLNNAYDQAKNKNGFSNPCTKVKKGRSKAFSTKENNSIVDSFSKNLDPSDFNSEKLTNFTKNNYVSSFEIWGKKQNLLNVIRKCLSPDDPSLSNLSISSAVNSKDQSKINITSNNRHISIDPNHGYFSIYNVPLSGFNPATDSKNLGKSLFIDKNGNCVEKDEFIKENDKYNKQNIAKEINVNEGFLNDPKKFEVIRDGRLRGNKHFKLFDSIECF